MNSKLKFSDSQDVEFCIRKTCLYIMGLGIDLARIGIQNKTSFEQYSRSMYEGANRAIEVLMEELRRRKIIQEKEQ